MVYVAFLLLTVSTLAVLGKPTGGTDDCVIIGGRTYCNKPDCYPQSEIDLLIAETNKNSLYPLKMGAHWISMSDLEDGSVEGNCEMVIKPNFTPFTMTKGTKTFYVVQSKFFNQSMPIVQCSEKNKKEAIESQGGDDEYYECFKDFIPDGSDFNTKCVQRTTTISLYIYIGNMIEAVDVEIDSDCVCAKEQRM